MTQTEFTFPPYHSQSETSQAAAEKILPAVGTLRRKVLDFIIGQGPFGATDQEIQSALDMKESTQRPRRGELVTQGLVRDSGRTRRTHSGRDATVWIDNCSAANAH